MDHFPNISEEFSFQVLSIIEESMDLVTELDENSAVAVATLSDLINYDKIETKSFSIEKKDVNVWSVLEKTLHPLSHQAKEKNIGMELISQISTPEYFDRYHHPAPHCDLNNLRLIGDSIKLGQVFRNLISNALKFTPPDGQIHIEGHPSSCLPPTCLPLPDSLPSLL
jgi:two-component system, sensor histidine kinase and response regulator